MKSTLDSLSSADVPLLTLDHPPLDWTKCRNLFRPIFSRSVFDRDFINHLHLFYPYRSFKHSNWWGNELARTCIEYVVANYDILVLFYTPTWLKIKLCLSSFTAIYWYHTVGGLLSGPLCIVKSL